MKKKLNLDVLVRVVVVLATAKSTFILKFDFLKATVRILNSHAKRPRTCRCVYTVHTVHCIHCTHTKGY